jgi:hypothetical protein
VLTSIVPTPTFPISSADLQQLRRRREHVVFRPLYCRPFGESHVSRRALGYFRWTSGTLQLASSSAGPSMLLIPREPESRREACFSDWTSSTADRDLSINPSSPAPVTDACYEHRGIPVHCDQRSALLTWFPRLPAATISPRFSPYQQWQRCFDQREFSRHTGAPFSLPIGPGLRFYL